MTRPQLIIDNETTGLDAARHQIWELAVVERDSGTEHLWRMKPDLATADPAALTVGRFYERTAGMCRTCTRPERAYDLTRLPLLRSDDPEWSSPAALASEVARLLDGATLIAANPTFDAGFLTAFLNKHGQAATWHYRLRDIGSMTWAWLHGRHLLAALPDMDAGTDDFARALAIDLEKFERHSALGDCRLVAAMLRVIEGGES